MAVMMMQEREHVELFDELRVVTSASWVARDFATAGLLPVAADLGLDVAADVSRTAWWCPGMFAARLARSGARVRFLGPPAHWQGAMAREVLGRDLRAATLGDLRRGPGGSGGVFAKVADIKVQAVPAQWWVSEAEFLRACGEVGLPDSTPALVTGTFLDLVEEHRCFVTAGQVTAASIYRLGEVTWDAWESGEQPSSAEAVAFAGTVLASLTAQPPGWVLDVGRTRSGEFVVVEANPSWCANPYHCDPLGAVRSIVAGQDPAGGAAEWVWEPGEYLRSRARPLTVRRPFA